MSICSAQCLGPTSDTSQSEIWSKNCETRVRDKSAVMRKREQTVTKAKTGWLGKQLTIKCKITVSTDLILDFKTAIPMMKEGNLVPGKHSWLPHCYPSALPHRYT